MHFCPHTDCDYRGWLGLGNLRANGHPSGGPWRQLHCTACEGYFPEHHGTIFHGKQAAVELIVRVLACLAEGLGHSGHRAGVRGRSATRCCTGWWKPPSSCGPFPPISSATCTSSRCNSMSCMPCSVPSRTARSARPRPSSALSRSPHWVWTAIDPVTKLLLAIDVGERTLAMAQRVVHQVAQVLAPGCVPLFLTDGFREYLTALLTHYGHWVQPPRRQAKGPAPKPRWMPLPAAALCAGGQDHAAPAPGRRQAPRGVRHDRGRQSGAGGPVAGRSTRRLWSASTSASASMWRRWDGGSARCARARRACGSSWRCTTCTTTSACPMPAYASRCRSRCPPTARARPRCGGRVRRRWRRD